MGKVFAHRPPKRAAMKQLLTPKVEPQPEPAPTPVIQMPVKARDTAKLEAMRARAAARGRV
jgi:hypothetical protein